MITYTVRQLMDAVSGERLAGDMNRSFSGVSTDTREDLTGRLFVPLIGERFDGHDFVGDAIQKGAEVILWQKDRPLPAESADQVTWIGVSDTLHALQMLAKSYRNQLSATVIGVTGSNGKTSTKDFIAAILATRFRVQKTKGNLNNHIGLPLMILSLEPDVEVAVLEMGMNHAGEISQLCSIASPDLGVITNIGESHIEFLGSRLGIAHAKFELIESLTKDGIAFLNGDEPLLRGLADRSPAPIRWFGFSTTNDIYPTSIVDRGLLGSEFRIQDDATLFSLPVPGKHQLSNALAAIAVGQHLGVTDEVIARGLAGAKLSAMRLEIREGKWGGQVINDAYNASPTSVRAAIQMLSDMDETHVKIAVLSDMLELGEDSEQWHRSVGEFVAESKIDYLITYGEMSTFTSQEAVTQGFPADHLLHVDSKESAIVAIKELCQGVTSPVVLVKASRGMKLEEIVQAIT